MMNSFRYIFEIPIYRLSPTAYEEEVERIAQRRILPTSTFRELFGDKYFSQKYEESLRKQISQEPSWLYNEIVGFIGVYFFFTDLRADYWMVNAKRISKNAQSKIEWKGELFQIKLNGNEGSQEIYNILLTYLDQTTKRGSLRHRYIDLQKLKKIGPNLNWHNLMHKYGMQSEQDW